MLSDSSGAKSYVYNCLVLAGVRTAPTAVSSSASDAAVSTDSVKQPVPELAAELSDPWIRDNSNSIECSDQQPSTSPNTGDLTASEHRSNEVQQDSKMTYSAVDANADFDQTKVLTQSIVDKETEDSQNKAQTEFSEAESSNRKTEELEDDQTKLTGKYDLDKTLEDDENKPSIEEYQKTDETDTTSTAEPIGVHDADINVEVPTVDDSEPSEDQFLSPAASEGDIVESVSPTDELVAAEVEDVGSSAVWSTKVPLLDTEPPAIDSDYEEAVLCEMDEDIVSANVGRNNHPDDNYDISTTTDQALPAATTNSSVKPKPM